MRRAPLVAPSLALLLLTAPARGDALRDQARALFGTLPAEAASEANPLTEQKVALGRMLYYDPRLSRDGELSCNSCHPLDRHGADGERTHDGERGPRNAPTVYNAAFAVAQFWDGRAADVEAQARDHVLDKEQMAMPDAAQVARVLGAIPGYAPLFQAAFPGEEPAAPGLDDAARAIGAFERRLVTPAPFDAWLAGDDGALDAAQKRGLQAFIARGCPDCHAGPLLGGTQFRKMGLVVPYPSGDGGRQPITGRGSDEHVFKVPSLRNVAKTGPYFHDGKVDDLELAVGLMARYELGVLLRREEMASIARFLESLTGELPRATIARPELPPGRPEAPAPAPAE